MEQKLIDIAVKIATKYALAGKPVERIIWIPPQSATQRPEGKFAIKSCRSLAGSETPLWEK